MTIELAIGGGLRFFRGARFGQEWLVTMVMPEGNPICVEVISVHRRA